METLCEGVTVGEAQMETSFPMKVKSQDRFYKKGDKKLQRRYVQKSESEPIQKGRCVQKHT